MGTRLAGFGRFAQHQFWVDAIRNLAEVPVKGLCRSTSRFDHRLCAMGFR